MCPMSYNCPDYRVSQDVSIANGILPATGTEKRPQNHYFDWAGLAAGSLAGVGRLTHSQGVVDRPRLVLMQAMRRPDAGGSFLARVEFPKIQQDEESAGSHNRRWLYE